MSTHFKFPPSAFVKHDTAQLIGHVERKLQDKGNNLVLKHSANPLRDGHVVLVAIDVLVALHAAFRKWRNHRRTLKALDELDEHQLSDIGLRREQASDSHFFSGPHRGYRPVNGADDPKRAD